MNLLEKIIEEKIKRYGILWLAGFAFLPTILLSSVIKFIKLPFDIPSPLDWIILVISWLLLIMFFLWVLELIKEKIFWPIYSIFRNRINFMPRISKWIFQGSLEIIGDSLKLTASDSGGLIKYYLYKNFIMKFNLQIPNGGRAGIVFRAQNLENYLMLEIRLADCPLPDGTIGPKILDIVPHTRFLGNWESFNITPEPYFRKDINLQKDLQRKIKYNQNGLKIILEVEDCIAKLIIKSGNETEEFYWNIPVYTESNILRHLTQEQDNKVDISEGKFVPKIWFRNKYGKVGFRAWGWQRVTIKDLKIEKI